MGLIDEEFIDFVVDFVKWSVKRGDELFEKLDLMVKYEFLEEDFYDFFGVVGNVMFCVLNLCE